ncbi:MAG: hypothetical protein ABW277_08675 [Longimicrobiaceae bacterium]
MRTWTLLILLGAPLASSCAERTPNGGLVMAPERYSLSAAERATLKEGIDVGALERLVAKVPPEHRAEFLRFWRADFRGGIVATEDPESAALLEQVWAPMGGAIPEGPAERLSPPYGRPVELVLVPRLEDARAGALVIREPAGGRDIIVLPEGHASAVQLEAAKGRFEADRRAHGLVPGVERRLMVRRLRSPSGDARHAGQDDNVVEQRYEGYLAAARDAPVEEIRGVGRGRRIVMIAPDGERTP